MEQDQAPRNNSKIKPLAVIAAVIAAAVIGYWLTRGSDNQKANILESVTETGLPIQSPAQSIAVIPTGTATPAGTPSPKSPTRTPSSTSTKSPISTASPAVVSASPAIAATLTPSPVKTFDVSGENFSFSLNEIRVRKGDTVKIVFKNESGSHDWVVDEFNARTPVISGGQMAEIQFVADKTGRFEYYCSVDGHRQLGMKGVLIVE